MQLISQLLSLFSRDEKKYMVFLLLLMSIGAILDAFSVGMILPVIAIISSPELLLRSSLSKALTEFLISTDQTMLILSSFIALAGLYILKNIFLTIIMHLQCQFIYRKQEQTAAALFDAYLRSPYIFHLARNSTELVLNVNSRVPDILSSLLPVFGIIIESLVVFLIFLILFYVDWISALGASIILGLSVYGFQRFTKQKIIHYSEIMQKHSCLMAKMVHESFGAVKIVKLMGRENFFVNQYKVATQGFMTAYSYRQLIGQLPRYFIESCTIVGMMLIVFLYIGQGKSANEILPVLALFGTAAFRLMPSLSKIVSSIAAIRFVVPELNIIHHDLLILNSGHHLFERDYDAVLSEPLRFLNQIEITNLSYHYPNSKDFVLKQINMRIARGTSVAFVGESGAGKSTLVDLIMGLLEPTSGEIVVDGVDIKVNRRSWLDKIGYVPQDIYLCDDSIRNNIAFGISNDCICDERIWEVLRIAKVDSFVISLPEQLDTMVGERGVRLSGGQKQRIGIARALYHDPEILIMDEATSSLDNDTEIAIADSMETLTGEKTLIVIAHRTATRDRCQVIFSIEQGQIMNVLRREE